MIVRCKKFIDCLTKKEREGSSRLKKEKYYVVLAMVLESREGISIFLQPEGPNSLTWFDADGFEFSTDRIPTSWVKEIVEVYGRKVFTMLPQSWSYPSFFEDLDNEDHKAFALFRKEVIQMYREEGWKSRYDVEIEEFDEDKIICLAIDLGDIETAIQRIYNGANDEEAIKNLVKIGEVCRDLDQNHPEWAQRYPGFPFNFAYEIRNMLKNGYHKVDNTLLIKTLSIDLPELIKQLNLIYADYQSVFDKVATEYLMPRAKLNLNISK